MAKTTTTSTHKEVETAFAEFKVAQLTFEHAINKFQAVFDPDDVSLDGIVDGLDETMSEIEDAIEEAFEDE